LSSGGRRVVVRLLDGAFPLYRRLLPDHAPLVAVAQVGAFGAAIRRVAVVAARSAPVRLVFTPGLVTAEAEGGAGDGASATDTVEVEYTGPRIAVWYNPGYLLDGLGAVDGDEVTIAFGAADPETAAASPTVLTGKDDDGFRYVLMPVVRTPG
jgi:DNA polymerase-3 subunit beta